MAECGVASRRSCERLIEEGKVRINGHPAVLGAKVNPKKDIVTVRGKKIAMQTNMRYIMLHKPRGYVTTVSDELGRKTVMDLIGRVNERVYPVGRLDRDSEGLLLLTNNGELANALMHPSFRIVKTYRVTVRPGADGDVLDIMRRGVEIDGVKTSPCEITPVSESAERSVLEFKIQEGRNREIRKMCEACGLEVARLKRTALGPLKLGMLQPGEHRELNENELKKLFRICSLNYEKSK